MTLLDHLEAFRLALWRGVAAVAVLLVPGFLLAPDVLRLLVRWICPPEFPLHYFTPLEPFFVQLKLGGVLALAGAFPVIAWEFGRFLKPGLYPGERRLLVRLFIFSVSLFLMGGALGIGGVMPLVMRFSMALATPEMVPVIGIGAVVNLTALLGLSFGVMFQLPLVMILLVHLGVVRSASLRRCRPLIVTGIFLAAAILTPPDVVSQVLLALPCWALFEIALYFCRRIDAGRRDGTENAAETPHSASGADNDSEIPSEDEPEKTPPEVTQMATDSMAVYRRAARRKRIIRPIRGAGRGKR